MLCRSLIFTLLVATTLALGQSTPVLRHGPAFGTFSSLRMHEETGDMLGAELTVVPQYLSAYVIFQCAEGEPSAPVFAPAMIRGDTIKFTIKQDNSACGGNYSVVATKGGVKLSRDITPGTVEFLPRQRSYWAK